MDYISLIYIKEHILIEKALTHIYVRLSIAFAGSFLDKNWVKNGLHF